MANQFGDTEVESAPTVNQFGDAEAAPRFQIPDVNVPHTPTDAENIAFMMRTTPEFFEPKEASEARAAKALETPIPISVTDSEAQVPEAFQNARIGQVFRDERHGLIRKISQTNYLPVRPGFLSDVGQIIKNLPEAIMVDPYAIQEPVSHIVENPDVRATAASIGSSIAGARMGAPLGPYGALLGGMGGALMAEPYVQSQVPSTATESLLRVASGGFNTPMRAFDALALKTGPRIATALEQGLIGAGMGEAQTVGNAIEQGRMPTAEELTRAPLVGGLTGATIGGLLGGQRAKPLLEPKQQNLANQSAEVAGTSKKGNNVTLQGNLNEMTGVNPVPPPPPPLPEPLPPEVVHANRQADLEAAFGSVKADNPTPGAAAQSAQVFTDEAQRLSNQEERIQKLIDTVSGNDDQLRSKILALRKRTPPDQFNQSLEVVADYKRNPQRYPEEVAKEIEGLVDQVKMGKITTTETPKELGAPNAFGDYQARTPDEAAGISMMGGTPEEVANLRRGLEPLSIFPKPLEYGAIPESRGGLYVSSDVVRPYLPGYDPLKPTAVQGKAADITQKAFEEGLKRDDVKQVLILAGGAGSGKSQALKAGIPPDTLVYDGTFGSPASLKRLQEAVASGKPVDVVYTHRNLEDAYQSMLERAQRGDQAIVPDDVFLKGHIEARKMLLKALDKYGNGDKVHFSVVDNTINGANAKVVEDPASFLRQVGKNSPSYEQATKSIQAIKAANAKGGGAVSGQRSELQPFEEPITQGSGEPEILSHPDVKKLANPEAGFVNPRLLGPLASSAAGGVTGFSLTERKPGESEQEFQARRLTNTLAGAGGGLVLGSAGSAATKAILNRAPATTNRELSAVRDMLKASDAKPVGMFDRVRNASFDFLTRANTAWAPLEKLQRDVYQLVDRPFKAGSYYDLADRGESIAGAVVHAQREAGLLADLVNGLPKDVRARFPEYLVLNRIKDRLERIPGEAAGLQDAVGRAQAELEAAKSKFADSKTLGNAQAVNSRKQELSSAITALNEEADRLRVAGWSLDDPKLKNPENGLAAMQQEVGPQNYAAMEKAGQDFQHIMLDNLRRQVDSGRMPQEVFNKIADSTDFYAPFKVMKHYEDAGTPTYTGGGRSVVNVQPITQKIKGIDDADLKLANPLEPAFEQIYKGTLLAEKNKFLREVSTLTALDKEGQFIRILKGDEKPRSGFKEVPFLRNGQVVKMEVANDVHEALTSPMSWAEKSVVLNSLRAGSTLFKMGATALQAPFQIKNALIYDPSRLAVMSKYGIKDPVDALRFAFMDYPVGMWSAFRTSLGHPDELGEKWLSSGAANSTFARVFNPEAFAKSLPKEESAAHVIWKNQFGLVPLNNASAIISSALEQSAKITGLKRALRFENMESMNPMQRERKWREVVHELRNFAGSPDFNRMGTDMGIINVLMPFTNARWQGFVSDAGRLVGNDKEGIAAKIRLATLVGLPAAGLMAWNLRPENKKDWEQIPEEERQRGFYIPLYQDKAGNETVMPSNMDGSKNLPKYFKDRQGRDLRQYYVLPKREMPQLMGNATEDFVRWLETNDKDSFDGLASTLLNVAAPMSLNGRNATEMGQSMLSGVNPVVRTPMEVALNKDMFRQKAIIPESRLGALQTRPDLAFAPTTPDFYKQLASMVPRSAPSIMQSPAVMQKVIEDFTGGFPRQFINPKDKPEQTLGERLTRSFRRSENVDLTDAQDAIDVAKGQSTALRSEATDVADAMVDFITKTKDPERAKAAIQHGIQTGQINEAAYKEIVRQLKERNMGYTAEQSQVSRLGKEERAFFYHERLKSLPAEERAAYIQDAVNKRLIDKDVASLMMQLK